MNYTLLIIALIVFMQNFIYASDSPSERLTTQTILSIINQKDVTNKRKVAQIKILLPQGDISRDCCPSPFSALYSEDECAVIVSRLRAYIKDRSI